MAKAELQDHIQS